VSTGLILNPPPFLEGPTLGVDAGGATATNTFEGKTLLNVGIGG
jgi:hypothetical protein